MNFDLTDEQQALRDAARDALSRTNLIAAAHETLDGKDAPDLWPTAREAGWPGLLIGEQHGGAGLGAVEAMLVAIEAGRVLAGVPLLGHVTASAILDAAPDAVGADALRAFAEGDRRAASALAMPPSDGDARWTVDPRDGFAREDAPIADVSPAGADDGASPGAAQATLTGTAAWVPDLPGADAIVVVATTGDATGAPIAVLVDADADGVAVEPVTHYDATRALGQLTLSGARGTVLPVDAAALAGAWHLAQGLLAAESLGAVETALEVSVAYAKERFTFGRPIGSYQAIKHGLVEILRQMENTRSLIYYAGWARQDAPDEFALAASAARTAGGHALDYAAREMIAVHGGIGATWEHDAPLFFRRAQLTRRLLGGTGAAADRVAGLTLAAT